MSKSKWVDIKKRLPDKDGPYLVYCESIDPYKPFIMVAWYNPNFGWSAMLVVWIDAITHWMPLPEPPRGKE